jgi:hypothetical protein
MQSGAKAAIAGTIILLAAVGVRIGMIYHERHAPAKLPAATASEKLSDDDLVFLKKKRPDSMADIKTLYGATVWVSAGGQIDYYNLAGHHIEYGKSAGTLLGAQALLVKDTIEQVAPKSATFRIPGGDRQVSLVFTLPKSSTPDKQYAAPIGYRQDGAYTFYTDEIFFYDDPHELYKHWGPEIWKAVDAHQVILGMNERQVELALGQVSSSVSHDYGNRVVIFSNMGHPMAVTFVNNKVTAFRPDQGY